MKSTKIFQKRKRNKINKDNQLVKDLAEYLAIATNFKIPKIILDK